MPPGAGPLRRSAGRVLADLRADPYLRAILLGVLVLALFGIWHRIPNFATWDGRDRLFYPLVVYGHVLAEPSLESLRESFAWSREPFGATFYFHTVALLPVLVAAAFSGSLDEIAEIPFYDTDFGFLAAWQATPEWIWTWGILLSRLVTVAFAVGCVYLTYRIGVAVHDRTTGRLAATFLGLTFGFLMLAKEVGEDVPALCFLLLALYLLVRYVQTGVERYVYAGSAVGGFALAVKLTMAPIVLLVPVAILIRAASESGDGKTQLWHPRLFRRGATLGLVAMLVGFPVVLVGRFDLFAERIFLNPGHTVVTRKGPDGPIWWWVLRAYLHGFGLPLAVAGFGGVVASLGQLRREPENVASLAVLGSALGLFALQFGIWTEVRVHHLLPTMPLILLFLAAALVRLDARRPALARGVVALLVLTTALYAGAGTAQYASMPRDQAHDWIEEHVPEDATMEIYQETMDNAVVTHDLNVSHPWGDGEAAACPEYLQFTYRDLVHLRDVPDDQRPHHASRNVSERAAYVRAIVDGETNYELAAEFGQRPPDFVPQRATPGSVLDVLGVGVYPHSDQYGDEQDLAANQYVAIFERTAPCEGPRSVPW